MADTPLDPNKAVLAVRFGVPFFEPYIGDASYPWHTMQGLGEFRNRFNHVHLFRHIEEQASSYATNTVGTWMSENLVIGMSKVQDQGRNLEMGQNVPCTTLHGIIHHAQPTFDANAQLGQKISGALQVHPADIREAGDRRDASEHTIDIGVYALPVLEPILAAD